jgi:C4-type Zn-finger protein
MTTSLSTSDIPKCPTCGRTLTAIQGTYFTYFSHYRGEVQTAICGHCPSDRYLDVSWLGDGHWLIKPQTEPDHGNGTE